MCLCAVMSRPRPGKNKDRHVDCYESSSANSSSSSSPVLPRSQRSTTTSQTPRLLNGVRATRQLRPRVGSTGSGTDSPRSLDTPRLRSGSAISSPLRSCRQGTSSPGEDLSEDSGIRVQHSDFQAMYQDVINIKALLYRLGRTVQETEAEKARAATQQNGFYSDVDKKAEDSQAELVTDLQRQVTTTVAAVRSGAVSPVSVGREGSDYSVTADDTSA